MEQLKQVAGQGSIPAANKSPSDQVKMIVLDGVLKTSDLPNVYLEFKKPIPKEGLQESKGAETHKGYDTLGYGYAWITERLNDVVGFCWRTVVLNEKVVSGKTSTGNSTSIVEMDVVLQLGNLKTHDIGGGAMKEIQVFDAEGKMTQKMIEQSPFRIEKDFEVLAEVVGFGWHRALNIADARKGAFTNGLKKAAGLMGIGNDAYKKAIDEENVEIKEVLTKKRAAKKPAVEPRSPVTTGNQKGIDKLFDEIGVKTEVEKLEYLKNNFKMNIPSMSDLTPKQVNYVLALLLKQKNNVK